MRVYIENGKLTGGNPIDIEITQDLLEKYIKKPVIMEDLEYDIDDFIEIFMIELRLHHRYGDDRSLLALAVVIECLNVSVVDGATVYEDIDKYLSENTPFDDSSSGFIMFILCQLEECEIIHGTKYRELTEKGKVLLWLFRQFEFVDTKI